MGSLLADHTNSRDNNFNLLRFLAAGMVLFAHSYPLTGTEVEPLFGGFKLGHVAVDIFFVTSGLLVTRSLLHRGNVIAFAWARFVRIYPALFVAVFLCAIPLGLMFTTLSAGEYLSQTQVYKFLVKNSALVLGNIEYSLPGVFADNAFPEAVNGSLWTLPWEIRMYALLWFMGVGSLLLLPAKRTPIIEKAVIALAILGTVASIAHQWGAFETTPIASSLFGNGLRLLGMFFVGGAFYVLRHRIRLYHTAFLIGTAALFLTQDHSRTFSLLYSTLLCYLVLYIGYIPGGFLRAYNKLGDYSYGLYIYAFPVQQAIAHTQPQISVMNMFWQASAITLALAVCSWYLLEKPLLRQKDAYLRIFPAKWTGAKDAQKQAI